MKVVRLAKKFQDCNFKFYRKDTYIGDYKSKDIRKDSWIGKQKIKSCLPIDNESIKIIIK
jgi:hypothetical protein